MRSLIHWKLKADTTVWVESSATRGLPLCTDTDGIVPWFGKQRLLMLYAGPDSSSAAFILLWVVISHKQTWKT